MDKWISTKDKLPEDGKEVLFYGDSFRYDCISGRRDTLDGIAEAAGGGRKWLTRT